MNLRQLITPRPARGGLLAVEKASLAYNALTTVLLLTLYARLDHPLLMLAQRALIAAGTLLLAWLTRFYNSRLTDFVRATYQLVLLSYWYPDTYEFNQLFPNLDHLFAHAEQWLFGCQPSLLFSQRFPQLWVSELLNLGYVSYYPMILFVSVAAWLFSYDHFQETVFVIAASFFVYYVVFIILPVVGPQYYFPAVGLDRVAQGVFPSLGDYFRYHSELLPGTDGGSGFFYNLVNLSQEVGERPTAAFPSSHVGLGTILLLLSWRDSRPLFYVLVPFYVCLCCATVYIQAHYLLDAIVGFLTSFLVYALTTWVYRRYLRQGCGSARP